MNMVSFINNSCMIHNANHAITTKNTKNENKRELYWKKQRSDKKNNLKITGSNSKNKGENSK